MRARTAVIFLVAGAVLTFAVSSRPAVLDVQLAGIILMVVGAIGLWPSGGKALVVLGRSRLRQFVEEIPPVQGVRVPLDELMDGRPQASAVRSDVWTLPGGHQQRVRDSAAPPEVTRDDEDREPATANQHQ
jgi:hypothetical protein